MYEPGQIVFTADGTLGSVSWVEFGCVGVLHSTRRPDGSRYLGESVYLAEELSRTPPATASQSGGTLSSAPQSGVGLSQP